MECDIKVYVHHQQSTTHTHTHTSLHSQLRKTKISVQYTNFLWTLRTVCYKVVLSLAVVATLGLRSYCTFGCDMVGKLSTVITPGINNTHYRIISKVWWQVYGCRHMKLLQYSTRCISGSQRRCLQYWYLSFLNFFLLMGLLCEPRQSLPEGPVTTVASSPLSDTLHSNSTRSSSPRLLNPDILMTLWGRKYELVRVSTEVYMQRLTIPSLYTMGQRVEL